MSTPGSSLVEPYGVNSSNRTLVAGQHKLLLKVNGNVLKGFGK